jgi:hypothetical protein
LVIFLTAPMAGLTAKAPNPKTRKNWRRFDFFSTNEGLEITNSLASFKRNSDFFMGTRVSICTSKGNAIAVYFFQIYLGYVVCFWAQ